MVELAEISVNITSRSGSGYKSIRNISWPGLPGFAVLTGRNGSGKTQLLEVIAYALSGTVPQEYLNKSIPQINMNVEVVGDHFQPHEVAYVPGTGRFSGGAAAHISNFQNMHQQLLSLAQNSHAVQSDISHSVKSKRALQRIKGRPFNPQSTPAELRAQFSDIDDTFMLDDIDLTQGLSSVFLYHRFKMMEADEAKRLGQPARDLGPAPWDIVNDALSVAELPYEIINPLATPMLDPYEIMLRERTLDKNITLMDLSSGEKVLFQLVLWLYASGRDQVLPRLMLLDEPDAHLHPAMTQQFLNVINEVLVEKHGVRVIMTTHSPSTVALAPDNSVFCLERGAAVVKKATVRASVVSELTSGLVIVSRSSKFVFVEDEYDVGFYETVRDILGESGPGRDPEALDSVPTMAFLPASVGSGRSKVSGGSSVVQKWVSKLDAEPLTTMFSGVIDRDTNNQGSSRVLTIGRYSVENYELDPLNVYALLIDEGCAPHVEGLSLSPGNEHLLRNSPSDSLQRAVMAVTILVEGRNGSLNTGQEKVVHYTNGKSVMVPAWIIDHRGHDLLPLFQQTFGQSLITPPKLRKAMKRARFIPKEIASVLHNLQSV